MYQEVIWKEQHNSFYELYAELMDTLTDEERGKLLRAMCAMRSRTRRKSVCANFPTLFKEMGLDLNNIDLMCALHMDRPKHLHLHFLFFEKEPKCKYRKKELEYRHKGKIAKDILDKMHVRLTMWLADDKERLHKSRDEAIRELRRLSGIGNLYYSNEDIRKEILSLAKDLPKDGRCVYGSKPHPPRPLVPFG